MLLPGIGASGQEKLKKGKVLVIGIGGLGSFVLQYLTAMGVGTLGLMDFDIIEEENLSHQVFYGMHDIGKLKAVVTKGRLSDLNPLIRFNMLNVQLHGNNSSSIIPNYDIIVDTTNKSNVHYLINDECIKYNKVMVYGWVCKLEGRVSVFNYKSGPSYRCAYSENSERSDGECAKNITGMPGILPGVTGSILANEVLKIITGQDNVLSGKIMIVDTFNYLDKFVEVKRNKANFTE